ncbi:MAG: RluA family pseudouridine synthase [Clostridia bacterium]|nr:RluA family pseudouridine synthase [Clostridia bacterium]
MAVRTSLSYTAEADHKKLDFFLRSQGISRRLITDLKYIDCLLINGTPATTIHPVKQGDTVTLLFPAEETLSCEPQQGDFTILYEDEDMLAVEKPAGIATHPALGTKDGTLGNFVSQYYVEQNCLMPFRPISRLDKDTSGLVLIAKHKLSHHNLAEQQAKGLFQKQYLALVSGIPKNSSGEITFPIARESETSLKRVCRSDGKTAHTIYNVITQQPNCSLLKLDLKTGRTHQLRVHLSEIGHPILGDKMYGTTPAKRLYLHSYKATFFHPVTGNPMEITAPCNFYTLLSQFENEEQPL